MADIDNTADPIPLNRWEQSNPNERGYGRKFRQLVEQGQDVHGEARLADALAPRGSVVLDAGSGMGRVGARLREVGHDVTAVEKDPELVAMSRELYPDLPVIEADILAISPELLRAHGRPTAYDLVVLVGNVMILLAPDTERRALSTVAAVLRPGGRLLGGFHPAGAHHGGRSPTPGRAVVGRLPSRGWWTGARTALSACRVRVRRAGVRPGRRASVWRILP